MSRYQFIEQVATTEPVQVLCRLLHVSSAGYYQWLSRAARPMPSWELAAAAAFSRHAQRYGTRRLRAELRAEGYVVGRHALRIWLRRRGLWALSTRPHRPRTTMADPAAAVAENLLLGQPAPPVPNQVWVGDITYLPLVLSGHLARSRLAPRYANDYETGAQSTGTGPDATTASSRPNHPRRPLQPVYQRRVPYPPRKSASVG